MQGDLYLYIPLLTMGLMSQEYNRGSIKLLYSSPVTNKQIIFGKYLSMIIYALILVAILSIYYLFTACTIKNIDHPFVLSALLGVFLMICAYAAIDAGAYSAAAICPSSKAVSYIGRFLTMGTTSGSGDSRSFK